MGKTNNLKVWRFNKKAPDPKNKHEDVPNSLQIEKGNKIADIGVGDGYFSMQFSDAVGRGEKVYIVDTNSKFLKFIENNAAEKGLENIETILAAGDKLNLPEGSQDLIFMRNVYHHMQNGAEYFKKIKVLLNLDGKAAVMEDKPCGFLSFHVMFGRYVKQEVIVEEMGTAGYWVDENFDFLPE